MANIKISIRASKHQKTEMTRNQLSFASSCAGDYLSGGFKSYRIYQGKDLYKKLSCDVYRTKTQISAVVYFK